MRPLFDIGTDLLSVMNSIGDDGEVPDDVLDYLKSVEIEEGLKLDNYINLIRKFEADEKAAQSEASRYAKMAESCGTAIDGLKKRLRDYMEYVGKDRMQSATNRTIRIQANGGKVPLEIVPLVDPENVDVRFRKVTVQFDNDAIRNALQNGEQLEFAKLGEKGSHLRIV